MPMESTTRLSEHFTLGEFLASQTAARTGIDNTPSPEIFDNLLKTAALMEQVRMFLGARPIFISSGYRCPELNAAIGGAAHSAHMTGRAADFTCPSFGSVHDVCLLLEAATGLEYDQLIREFDADGQGWCHIAWSEMPQRQMTLTIDGSGTHIGIV